MNFQIFNTFTLSAAAVMLAAGFYEGDDEIAHVGGSQLAAEESSALGALFDFYLEESDSAQVQSLSRPERAQRYREWLDRFGPVVADAPDGRMKASVLREMSVLASALGDRAAAVAAAEGRFDAATDPADKGQALFQAARIRHSAARRAGGEKEDREGTREFALAAHARALQYYRGLDVQDRLRVRMDALQSAVDSGKLLGRMGRHAEAAERFALAASVRAELPAESSPSPLTMPPRWDRDVLRITEAAARIAAEDFDAADAIVAEVIGDGPVPASGMAFKAAAKAGLGGAGGTYLLDWLGRHPADDLTPKVKAALAFGLDDAGRDEALALLVDLRENHAADLAPLKAGDMGRRPYASVLYRLERSLRKSGMTDLAKEIAADSRKRYPDDPRASILGVRIEIVPDGSDE